ncbi:helix-turn-helix domain-containing protein [Frigidibacter sp. SD6-1]|uniref:helix-turn-helix domain-containing protein n=1 Tax=Frigidibacter sp. SD6-1 TaxID=3032581 RepID=UPI0024DF9362|nr:helix-turn-helix domain-containing protein [Frigidibacter sp. SD6-1]
MRRQRSDNDAISSPPGFAEESDEADLWFLPGPPEDEPDLLPPLPRPEPTEATLPDPWRVAQAVEAKRLARVAMRLGALDDRLRRGPPGWRHRLALTEAADLGWFAGARIPADRLGLWIVLRTGSVEEEDRTLAKTGWAFRRLSGGPGPDADLAAFLGRHDTSTTGAPLADRITGWTELMAETHDLHPLTRACLGFHLWPMAGIGPEGERLEAAVTAARIAAEDCRSGALFAPLTAGGAGGLRATGTPARRLRHWLDGIDAAIAATMLTLDMLEDWRGRAGAAAAPLSGRTPPLLLDALTEWPLVSAPMAERLTGQSRAAVQRGLAWLEATGLVREITGQGRFRFWTVQRP